MRIAFFTDNYLPQTSGVATSVDYFAQQLTKIGHTVYIFAPKVRNYKDTNDHIYRLSSVRLIPSLPEGARLPLPIFNRNFWKMVAFDFDLVHAHGNGAFPLLGLTVAKAKKIPFIQTFHIQVENYAHYFFKGRLIKPGMMNKLLLKNLGNICDGVIAPSEKMRKHLVKEGVAKNIQLIPNFVDFDKFKNIKKGFIHKICKIPASHPILLSVGRIGKEKNFEFLVKVLEVVSKDMKNIHLVIVGPDWGEISNLKKLSKQLHIEDKLHFTGNIAAEDIAKVYKDADIFVFASTSEVHPMVAIEAAASGLPLIVANDAAYKGIVLNNKNGYLLPLEKESFGRKIIQLLNNPKLLKTLRLNSPKIAQKNFSPYLLTNRLISLYEKILKQYSSH